MQKVEIAKQLHYDVETDLSWNKDGFEDAFMILAYM